MNGRSSAAIFPGQMSLSHFYIIIILRKYSKIGPVNLKKNCKLWNITIKPNIRQMASLIVLVIAYM